MIIVKLSQLSSQPSTLPLHNHQHMKTSTTIATAALLVTLCCACVLAIDTEHFLHPAGLAKVLLALLVISLPAVLKTYTWLQTTNGMNRGVVMPEELAERLQGSAESMMPSAVAPSLLCYASGQTVMLLLLGVLKWAAVIDFDRVITIAM